MSNFNNLSTKRTFIKPFMGSFLSEEPITIMSVVIMIMADGDSEEHVLKHFRIKISLNNFQNYIKIQFSDAVLVESSSVKRLQCRGRNKIEC